MKNTSQSHEGQSGTQTKASQDIYQNVTDAIITQLELGTIPWHKPWNGGMMAPLSIPKNLTTGQKYRGINIPLLWMSAAAQDFTTQEWGSFKQWQAKEHIVAKGQKGTQIIYYDTFEKEQDGKVKQIPFVKMSYVFNRCQLKVTSQSNSQNQQSRW